MRIHIFRPDYGEAGFTLPCPACGREHDPGDWYFARPCPGVSPKTLKGWEYRYCSPKNWRRFAEAVRIFLERAEAAKRETDPEEEVNP